MTLATLSKLKRTRIWCPVCGSWVSKKTHKK